MSVSDRQLPLGLGHEPAMSRLDFVVGDCNRDALAAIEGWPDWPTNVTLLSGPEGSGKTHLVRVWQAFSSASIIAGDAVARTDLDRVIGGPLAVEDIEHADETALFHLLNRAREQQAAVLLTTRDPALAGSVVLQDLASRLRAGRPLRLMPPDDDFLRRVLVKHFSDRQLVAPSSLLDYLIRRMERSYAAAASLVVDLDELALASGKPIGRQLAATLFAQSDR